MRKRHAASHGEIRQRKIHLPLPHAGPQSIHHPFFINLSKYQWLNFNKPLFFFPSSPRRCEYHEVHEYFIPLLLTLKKRRKLIRGPIAAYWHVSVSTVESKDGLILIKPLCAHCSILAVLSSRLLKLHKSGDGSDSAVTSCGFALGLITAEVQGSWIISCQKVLELQQNEFCVQNHLCGFYCFPSWKWGRAEIRQFARGWREAQTTRGEGWGRWLPRHIHHLADCAVLPACIARKINYLNEMILKGLFLASPSAVFFW